VPESVHVGNAHEDASEYHGWILGHFVEPEGVVRHSGDVEIKWDVHRRGDRRPKWVEADDRTAVCILFSGRIRISFPDREVTLAEQGDYVVWRKVGHTWSVEEDCIAVVVRWPSIPGYAPHGEA
jgi:hypothetical protein